MSIKSTLSFLDGVVPTSDTVGVELSDSLRVSKASLETRFDGATGELLTCDELLNVSLFERRGKAKLEPPKLETVLDFAPSSKTGCSSFGVVRGREYFGLLVFSMVGLALGKLGANPCPKLNEVQATTVMAESVVQTNSVWREDWGMLYLT
jgi:hypothetical protein